MISPIVPQHVFEKIEHQSMEDGILRSVRNAIISGSIGLGQHLNETDMARQMSVSRIPIREALKKLEQEGLVVRHANRGVFVVDFDEQDVLEVFSLRALLESMAIEWAIPHLTEPDYVALRQMIDKQKQAIQDREFDELARQEIRFHETICIRANHERLLKSWREIYRQGQVLLTMRYHHLADFTPSAVPVDHELILQAMEAGDPAMAAELTRTISERVEQECLEALRNYRPD
jgi:DNA-binding GntR family transcriptional regulator